jgi:predicted secreted Zn-dependent protease
MRRGPQTGKTAFGGAPSLPPGIETADKERPTAVQRAARILSIFSLCLALLACGALPRLSSGDPTPAAPLPTAAVADVSGAEISYYDIEGATAADLGQAMRELGPVAYDGWKGSAATNWYISWNWPGYGSQDCQLGDATVSYTVRVTLPQWQPPARTSPELVTDWNRYVLALASHEQQHVDFVPEGAADVEAAIRGATCQTADAAAMAAIESIRQRDRDYDAATDHGASQGVVFP